MLHRIIALIIKELQVLLRDPQGRRILIIPVILQLGLFPAAATLEVRNNTLAVLNQDLGKESTELLQRVARAEAFTKVILLRGQQDLEQTVELQRALLVLQFPPDFSRAMAEGRAAPLQVILDGRRSNSGQIALGYLQSIIDQYLADRDPGSDERGASRLVVRHWYNPNLQFTWFIVPSLVAIITTATSLIVTSLSVAREREQGTFDQLLVSPLTPWMIMLGKAVPALLVSMGQATIVLLAAIFVFGIPFQGSLLLLYGSMVFYILALVGFGLAISSICATQQQAFLGVFCFMMPAVLRSGFTAPIENMPLWLQPVTWINPLRFFVTISKGVFLKDLRGVVVWQNLWPLMLIAVGTLSVAGIAFRRRAG